MRIGDFRVFRQWFSIACLSGEMGDALCVVVAVQFTELCDRRKLEDDLALEIPQFFRRENPFIGTRDRFCFSGGNDGAGRCPDYG